MFRLIRILIVAILLAGIYFYLQQTPYITASWQRTSISASMSLAFPSDARHHTRRVHQARLGDTRLEVYDLIRQDEAYICLRITPHQFRFTKMNLPDLLDPIRQLNDTADAQISLKKQFSYRGQPAYEYHAKTARGQSLWVRLIKFDDTIVSLIYAVDKQPISRRSAENFFDSLQF